MLRIAASEIVPLRPLTPRMRSGFTSPIVASSVPPSAMSLRANAACSSVSGVDPSLAKSFHGSRSRPSSPSWSYTKKLAAASVSVAPAWTIAC